MASLYIKKHATAELAAEVANLMGVSKTEAVHRALLKVKADLPPPPGKPSLLEWLKEHRRKHPLPPPTGLKADKAFFDEMWGEDPD